MKTFNHIPLTASILAFMLTASAGAVANIPEQEGRLSSLTVEVSDLNLSSEKGVSALYTRLVKAANTVCGPDPVQGTGSRIVDRKIKRQRAQCVANALDVAVNTIGNEQLTDMNGQ